MVNQDTAGKILALLDEKTVTARKQVKTAILDKKTGVGKVDKAMEQYLLKWDDTTRPGVLALAAEAVGGYTEVVKMQAALLFIDATMDIHDDIIDESVSKKNKKTVYGKLGKEMTLLIGDELMVRGFSALNRALEPVSKEMKVAITDSVDRFLTEVVEAHVLESSYKIKKLNPQPETYFQILTNKAADIEGHMKVGAICGGGSADEVDALGKYGRKIGTLLAIRSEFVDIFEPEELTHRMKHEILPLPILYALKNKIIRKRILEILSRDNLRKKDCDELLQVIYKTKEIAVLKQKLLDLQKEAIRKLNILSKEEKKDELRMLASFLTEDL
jgi:geranylgeranyl pyrophosphate synthase